MTMEQAPITAQLPMRAGGRATEAGMAFQAAVATWFAAHILVRLPVGGRFGINNQALPISIRLETGEGLDDIDVTQSDGGAFHIQCKTTANLGTGAHAPLAKTIGQLVRWVADAKTASRPPDRNRHVALLAVHANAPQTLNNLESGCRAFHLGGEWAVTRDQRNQAERSALHVFEAIAAPAWIAHCGNAPDNDDLVDLVRIFHIARFTMNEGESDWREVSRLLGRLLYDNEVAGDAVLRDLRGIVRDLIRNGAPANRDGLLRALRQRGHHDIRAPGYEADVAKLLAETYRELTRLSIHSQLPIGAGLPITRDSDAPLIAAILAGSLLVVGEPGAGKTGALVHAAKAIAAAGDTIVFLSIDRFSGVAITADLASELGLTHPLIDTLAAMPGAGRKILFIDALDAARGGPSEAIFTKLIEDVHEQLANEWIVVASIRTFDLKNGRRFRQVFVGTPADTSHVESGLAAVRHFLVPRLSETDLATVRMASPDLGTLLASAPQPLTELLRNIFNLSLAAQLLANGTASAVFSAIRTQSGLIDAYEDARLNKTQLQQAAAAAAAVMASRGRLSVRKVLIRHAELDAVIQTGVLAESADLVSFSHHVLFDHITGRFYLEWDDPTALLNQLSGSTSTALLLAPALRFAIERLWRDSGSGRIRSWQLITSIFSLESIDPVISNVALRIIVENIEVEDDIRGLITQVVESPGNPALAALIRRLASFAVMGIKTAQVVTLARAITWARLAEVLVATGLLMLIDPARILLHALFDHGDLTDATLLNIFNRTARALLEQAWETTPPLAVTSESAIRFVGKSFAASPTESRVLLSRILHEPHFSQHADREARWLADQIVPITRVDPEFTVEVYATLYSQTITDSATSWLGGRSRIMPLSSNRRQDYEHCRWRLGKAMGEILVISPSNGTRALIDALIGQSQSNYNGQNRVNVGSASIELRGYESYTNDWNVEEEDGHTRDDDLLRQYVQFLRECDLSAFAASMVAASRDYATSSVWARIFGVGCERVAELGDLLWPLMERPDFLENTGTMRDAIRFCATAWPSRTREERIHFETMVIDESRFTDNDALNQWYRIIGSILAQVPENTLELDAMRTLRHALNAAELLTTGGPISRETGDFGGHLIRDQLRRSGVDIDAGPNRELLNASDALRAHVERTPTNSLASSLASLWGEAIALLALIDGCLDLHDQVSRSTWGHIAHAVERIASSPNYVSGTDGMPDIATMFTVLELLTSSRYPEPRETVT